MPERIQKILSSAGVASRRKSEELIRTGRVQVNGEPAAIGDRAEPGVDLITVDGEPVAAQTKRYLALNKPAGHVTTVTDTHGRPTVIDLVDEVYGAFGLTDVKLVLATRPAPDKREGTDEMWDRAEAALDGALRDKGRDFELAPGEGAFYGPKIEFHVTDPLGRDWQLGTLQVAYFLSLIHL